MDILLYLLITVFIGYIAYALGSLIFKSPSKSKSEAKAATPKSDTVKKPETDAGTKAEQKPPAAKPSKPAQPKPAAKAPAAEAKPAAASSSGGEVIAYRNPETGEEARIPPSYPFAKRWIKDALVKEGLLDKIYKNVDLENDAAKKKVADALEQLKALDKYAVREE